MRVRHQMEIIISTFFPYQTHFSCVWSTTHRHSKISAIQIKAAAAGVSMDRPKQSRMNAAETSLEYESRISYFEYLQLEFLYLYLYCTCALLSRDSISLLCSMATSNDWRNSETKGSATFLVVLYFSWMIFSSPHFFTVPGGGRGPRNHDHDNPPMKRQSACFFLFFNNSPLNDEQFKQSVLLRHFSEIFFFRPRFCR